MMQHFWKMKMLSCSLKGVRKGTKKLVYEEDTRPNMPRRPNFGSKKSTKT